MNRNQIILLIGGVLLLCLCITFVGGGTAFLWWGGPTTESIAAFEPPTTEATAPPATDTTAADNAPFEPRSIYSGGRLERLHAAVDEQGALHIFVREEVSQNGGILSEKLFHLTRTPDGAWSEATRLPTDNPEKFDPGLVDVIRNPANQICLALRVSLSILTRCLQGTQWTEAEHVRRQSLPGGMVAAFAPDGSKHAASFGTGFSMVSVDGDDIPGGEDRKMVNEIGLLIDETDVYHLAWRESGGRLKYVTSTDKGQTWSDAEILAEGETSVWAVFHLENDGQGGMHLVWTGDEGIFYRRWQPERGWAETVQLGQGLVTADLAVDAAGLAHAAWGDEGQLHYAQQQPNGEWVETRVITEAEVTDAQALQRKRLALAVDGQEQRHFVWVGAEGGCITGYCRE